MTKQAEQAVILDIQGPVARVRMNRPEALNALNRSMTDGLLAAFSEIAAQDGVRAIILDGAGDAFMAGGDLKWFGEITRMPDDERRRTVTEFFPSAHGVIEAITDLPLPVIAGVHGACAGYGLSLMLACDLAVAAEGTRFTTAYSLIGTSPDGGATHALPRLVGRKKAFELMAFADRFDAEAARDMGLINRIVAPDGLEDACKALAERLAGGPRKALARTKALLNAGPQISLGNQLDAEQAAFIACAMEADFDEGIAAFLEKRKADFGSVG